MSTQTLGGGRDVRARADDFLRWLARRRLTRRRPSPAARRDGLAVYKALRSGARDADELERVTGLGGIRCRRALRLAEAMLLYQLREALEARLRQEAESFTPSELAAAVAVHDAAARLNSVVGEAEASGLWVGLRVVRRGTGCERVEALAFKAEAVEAAGPAPQAAGPSRLKER